MQNFRSSSIGQSLTRLACLASLAVPAMLPVLSLVAVAPAAHAAEKSTAMPAVSFVNLTDNAVVTSPFLVKFAATGIETRPAGDPTPNSGHHHLLINHGPMPVGEFIPADDTHIHFGKGQTETTLTLPPGQYLLTLQFGDLAHRSMGAGVSKSIHVTVQ